MFWRQRLIKECKKLLIENANSPLYIIYLFIINSWDWDQVISTIEINQMSNAELVDTRTRLLLLGKDLIELGKCNDEAHERDTIDWSALMGNQDIDNYYRGLSYNDLIDMYTEHNILTPDMLENRVFAYLDSEDGTKLYIMIDESIEFPKLRQIDEDLVTLVPYADFNHIYKITFIDCDLTTSKNLEYLFIDSKSEHIICDAEFIDCKGVEGIKEGLAKIKRFPQNGIYTRIKITNTIGEQNT